MIESQSVRSERMNGIDKRRFVFLLGIGMTTRMGRDNRPTNTTGLCLVWVLREGRITRTIAQDVHGIWLMPKRLKPTRRTAIKPATLRRAGKMIDSEGSKDPSRSRLSERATVEGNSISGKRRRRRPTNPRRGRHAA